MDVLTKLIQSCEHICIIVDGRQIHSLLSAEK